MRMGENEAGQERLLLAGRALAGLEPFRAMAHDEIARMRTDEGAPGGGVAAAVLGEHRAVAVLGGERRHAGDQRLDVAG